MFQSLQFPIANRTVHLWNTTVTPLQIFIGLILFLGLYLQGCAATKMVAVPTEEAQVTPNRTFAMVGKEGVNLSVTHTKTPYSIDEITTFQVQVYNTLNSSVEFIPKSYLLFDLNGAQYQALGPNALAEASSSGSYHRNYYHFGFGYGYPYRYHHSLHFHHGFGHHFYTPYSYGRRYKGMIAKALPLHPVTVHAKSRVAGNIYFPVNPKHLDRVEVLIVRLNEMPKDGQPQPREIEYRFAFDVVK